MTKPPKEQNFVETIIYSDTKALWFFFFFATQLSQSLSSLMRHEMQHIQIKSGQVYFGSQSIEVSVFALLACSRQNQHVGRSWVRKATHGIQETEIKEGAGEGGRSFCPASQRPAPYDPLQTAPNSKSAITPVQSTTFQKPHLAAQEALWEHPDITITPVLFLFV